MNGAATSRDAVKMLGMVYMFSWVDTGSAFFRASESRRAGVDVWEEGGGGGLADECQ